MTVIAWDGKTLAADRRLSTSWGQVNTTTKIHHVRGCLVAVSGSMPEALEMREWFAAGGMPSEFPKSAREEDAALLVINPDGGIDYYTKGPIPTRREPPFAGGIGSDFALAAMHCGRDARGAVEVACALSTYCGNGIDTLTLE